MYTEPMYLNRRLIEDIGINPNATTNPDMFGIEIELEGRNLKGGYVQEDIQKYWTLHNDNSLRAFAPGSECCEYVFNRPTNMEHTYEALNRLFGYLNGPGIEVFKSYRTSVHVHLNYALEKARTVYNAMVLSIILDELFVSQNGSHRIGNNFCLRARDAEGQISEIIKSTENYGNIFSMNASHRYSSTNFMSLLKFGTIEYRSLECTTDLARVKHWIDTLQRIKVAARAFDNPKEIVAFYNRMTPQKFLSFVLGPQSEKYEEVEDYDIMLRHGMRLAGDLAYCATWVNQTEENKKKEPPKPKKPKKSYAQLMAEHAIMYGGGGPSIVAGSQQGVPIPVGAVPSWVSPLPSPSVQSSPAYTYEFDDEIHMEDGDL